MEWKALADTSSSVVPYRCGISSGIRQILSRASRGLPRFFDQIRFYPVSEEELLKMREDFPRGEFKVEVEETTFNLGKYLAWLNTIEEESSAFRQSRQVAFQQERAYWKELGIAEHVSEPEGAADLRRKCAGGKPRCEQLHVRQCMEGACTTRAKGSEG